MVAPPAEREEAQQHKAQLKAPGISEAPTAEREEAPTAEREEAQLGLARARSAEAKQQVSAAKACFRLVLHRFPIEKR